jgi:hypothetical protein
MNLDQVEKQVIQLCEEVGAFIRQEAKNFDRSRIELKDTFTNLVSICRQGSGEKINRGIGFDYSRLRFYCGRRNRQSQHE